MSTYRGFDKGLISRATRAKGARYYFDEDTLRFFDAYGGRVLSSGPDHVVMVESIRDTWSDTPRQYRVIMITFHRELDSSGSEREHVKVLRLGGEGEHYSARSAIKAYNNNN